ncbi:ABC-2 type transport system ATP-binding protein [Clostridium sp. DSM 8431]|uniref:ABC transporter ATP-binding protein n=1 Tax=Clostridium sp. DSM 8431 TaxID=1761781 RepID=UPI0008E07B5C|nr:ATP-binding cassette domain-containing protein [Clostridium sp. DSM 8431]SFU84123.1 ABC-2 type transport system ATP-binding protein [Clostridium sp. DSM 8431]
MSEENIIEIVDYTKSFKGTTILNKINLNVKKGKTYGIIGRNGSGKTLIFKAICGFIRPTSGYVKVKGQKIGSDVDFPDNVGALIEQPGFLPNYSAFDNLKFLAQINNKIDNSKIIEVLHFMELPIGDKKVKEFSLGMKQRLGIAQAIMEDPEILILDEPFNGLDKYSVEKLKEKLIQIKDGGKTILLTSHIERDVQQLSDYLYEIDNGILTNVKIDGIS